MHLRLRRADRGVHRRRDGHGNHLRERRLRGHRREHRGRHHRGSHRHRRHPDVRRERRRDDPADLQRDLDVPNGSASHPGWGEEASSRGSDEVRPDPVRDEAHPARVPDDYRRTVRRGEAHPARERGVRLRDVAHRERAGEPVVPRVPRSTGCCPRAVPWDRAWGRDLRAWELPGPERRRCWWPTRPEPARPEQRALRARGWELPGPEPERQRELRVQPVQPPRELALRVLPALPDGGPAWGRDGVRPVSLHSASRCCLQRDRPLRGRSVQMRSPPVRRRCRTGRIHAVDGPRGLRLWMMRT